MKRSELIASFLSLGLAFLGSSDEPTSCRTAWQSHGVILERCPAGTLRQTVQMEVSGVRRGAPGSVTIGATVHFTTSASDRVETAPMPRLDSVQLSLVDASNKATPVTVKDWKRSDGKQRGTLTLPELPDGDYKLHATYSTRVGKGELDVAIPLYTPARVHVITDRPLYEPGNTVRFRAVVLRARDLSPIDGRPGKWVIKDPSNEVLLEEKAPAGDWGVVAGTFPLDKAAPTGTWRVSWVSAGATDEVGFTVEPFTLPRFRVDASTPKPFYRPGDTPAIRGAVVYGSGAPVAKAALDIAWDITGSWPPPSEWQAKLLPKKVAAGANGRFELALPQIPKDLQGRVTMTARISAVDAAGDRVESSVPVLLSEEGIEVTAVTELGDGLVQSANNRMYLRVSTPDGRVVPNAKVNVKRAWLNTDTGIDAELDEDGVASLQIDPGAPVNIVIPPQPFRATPRAALVTRGEPEELIGGDGASLADQVEMDKWLAALTPCAKWVGEAGASDDDMSDAGGGVKVGFRVNAGGTIVAAGGGSTPLAKCVVRIVKQRRLPAGGERMYTVSFNFGDPDLPKLSASVESPLEAPPGLSEHFSELAASTRDCLPLNGSEGSLPMALTWRSTEKSKFVELGGWIRDPHGETNSALACVQSRVAGRITLDEEADNDSLGIVRFTVELPARLEQMKPQATTMLGYELTVTAEIEGKPAAKLRMVPGAVPNLRMRVTPILAKVGDTLTVEIIRGPDFVGDVPKEVELRHLKGKPKTAKLDDERKATFAIEPGTEGWVEVLTAGLRSLVYVKPQADLAVTLTAKEPQYKPGQMAELTVQTQLAGKGGQAAVGLFGVDESLGQLVSLAGPDAMSRLRPPVGTSTPAFGVLDGQALSLGRIRGVNAAAATVLRVTTIPQVPELDAVISAQAQTHFDPLEELTDHFYTALAELHVQARTWENNAPKTEKMRPKTMAALWNKALAACAKRGEKVDDAYGRKLRLSVLPKDLLSLVDPRNVIVVGTRLPEDNENWAAWVAKEKP